MSEPIRKSLALDDGAVSYLEWASAGPALHFSHANGFNAETYRALLAPLSRHHRVLASDMRGHGFSTLPALSGHRQRWATYCRDLARVLDRLHPLPLVLAGHSMGAIAALMLAAAEPQRVRALVLVEPVLVPSLLRLRLARLVGAVPRGPDLAARAAKRRDIFSSLEAVLQAYRGRGAFQTWPEEVLRDYLHGGLIPTGNGSEVRLACAPIWESENFAAAPHGIARIARKVRCPLTVVYAGSGTAREEEVRILARGHGSVRLVKVPGTTHFLPMERPDIVQEEIERIACPP